MRTLFVLFTLFVLSSCTSKKDILYLQNSTSYPDTKIQYAYATLQPNDIIRISVSALVIESALPYNFQQINTGGSNNQSGPNLSGYVVRDDYTINFPVLGLISVEGKTTQALEMEITKLLEDGGHLKQPAVNVRLINAKFTVLGEVGSPGTITYTDQNLTILQALGMAGDLTINGKRDDIILMREIDGVRTITHIDIKSTAIIDSPFYYIKPNDFILVNPNGPAVKRGGYITNLGALFGVVSFGLTMLLLLKK